MRRLALPPRLQGSAIDQLPDGVWRVWLHTNTHVYGTFLLLHPSGLVERVTTTDDSEHVMCVMPAGSSDDTYYPQGDKQ